MRASPVTRRTPAISGSLGTLVGASGEGFRSMDGLCGSTSKTLLGGGGGQRLAVDVEALDLDLAAQLLDQLAGHLLGDLGAQLVLGLLEARRRRQAPVLDLDQVEAELALDR